MSRVKSLLLVSILIAMPACAGAAPADAPSARSATTDNPPAADTVAAQAEPAPATEPATSDQPPMEDSGAVQEPETGPQQADERQEQANPDGN